MLARAKAEEPQVPSQLVNRNVTASRGRTSMRLEPELWDALQEICTREGVTLGEMVRRIEEQGHRGGRTSAVRVHVLGYFRSAADDAGHFAAGHGPTGGKAASNDTCRSRAEAHSAAAAAFALPV
jgi:predicted DNA-binding ribbon-helix-helix protein